MNFINKKIGIITIFIGIICFVIKGLTTTMDEDGIIHEYLILILIGYLLILVGIIMLIVAIIKRKK